MRATLQVHDVGGFKGDKKFEFDSKTLNLIEAPNSGGKSSLVKALSAVLSVPSDGRFESYFLKDAKKLGIKSDELNTQEGFVNIHREIGEVILDIDGKVDKYRVKQNGDYLELPQYGDQKFLFSGILSNDTKILRQLRNTDEDNEPDDFKWAVTLLSNAKNYDEIASHLKEEKETFLRIKLDAESAIKRSEKIRKELGELKQDLSQVEKSLLELEPKFKGTTKPLQDRKKIIDDIETATKQINQKENELKQKLHEKEQFERQLQQFKKQIKENEEALDNLELFGKRIKNEKEVDLGYLKREIISSINDEINDLREERGKIDGVYNLFYIAQANLHGANLTKCPLCEEGNLTNETLTQKLDELKKNKDGVSSKIMEKGQNIRLINVEYEKIIKEQKNLTDTLKDNKNKLSIHKKKLGGEILKKLEHLEFDLENKRFHKHELERKLDDLRKIISLDDEQVNKIYTENEKKKTTLMGIIDFKTNEINSATIEINGNFFSPDSAEKIAVKYVDYVDAGIKYTKGMAEKQRQEAATRFNNTIKTLMNELNFTEFKDLRLNKDFRLYIERVDSDTQEYVSQLASTLCTSEKLTIALMLQIALKETYLPHIPFLIIDDIMEDFDEERRQKIYKYLYSKAEEQDWIIIVTKLVENQEPLKVVKLSLK